MIHLLTSEIAWRSKSVYLSISVAALLLGVSLAPEQATAQPGARVCVSYNGDYAVKGSKGIMFKNACTKRTLIESNLSQSINFGKGRYMTCEHYASEYLKWEDWDPCYSMTGHSPQNYRLKPNDNQIYPVAKIPRDETIKGGTACGGSNCGVLLSFGSSRSFAYNAGFNVTGPLGIFGGGVGFTVTTSNSASEGYSFTWNQGLTPGLRFDFDGAPKIKWDYRNIFEIQKEALMASFSKGFSHADIQKQRFTKSLYCRQGQMNVQASPDPELDSHQTTATFNLVGSRAFVPLHYHSNYATANSYYEYRRGQLDGPTVVYRDYNKVQCGVSLKIASNPNVWRGASDIVKWVANNEYIISARH